MITFTVVAMNDQAEALARVMPSVLEGLMEEASKEDRSSDEVDDLTKARAVLGDVLTRTKLELDQLRAAIRRDRESRRLA